MQITATIYIPTQGLIVCGRSDGTIIIVNAIQCINKLLLCCHVKKGNIDMQYVFVCEYALHMCLQVLFIILNANLKNSRYLNYESYSNTCIFYFYNLQNCSLRRHQKVTMGGSTACCILLMTVHVMSRIYLCQVQQTSQCVYGTFLLVKSCIHSVLMVERSPNSMFLHQTAM